MLNIFKGKCGCLFIIFIKFIKSFFVEFSLEIILEEILFVGIKKVVC